MADDDRSLHERARAGDTAGILSALAAGAAVDARDPKWNRTALMEAVDSPAAAVEMVRLLIARGADVNAVARVNVDELTQTTQNVLSIALGSGDVGKVEALLDAGADVRYRRERGYEALVDVMFGKNPQQEKHLLEMVSLLIARGANLDAESEWGESALTVSAREGRSDLVRELVAAGADLGRLEWTGLMRAVALGTMQEVREELAKGASLEARDWWSRTAFLIAVQTGDVARTRVLLEAGADPNARGRCGKTACMYAVGGGRAEMLRWLIAHGAAVDAQDDYQHSALLEAAEVGDAAGARVLLEAGADVGHENCCPYSAMGLATTVAVVRVLMAFGGDLNEMSDETRALFTRLRNDGRILCTAEHYRQGKHPRFGLANPERMDEPFWLEMIRSGAIAYRAREAFEGVEHFSPPAVWSFRRFGKSINELPDGRIIEVAGEHEDWYDPDFHIYNDVVVHYPDGRIEMYGYPENVFPPTDFHTATLMGEWLYLVGSLGYPEKRRFGQTQVYRLHTATLVMERVETRGEGPGWISRHKARYDGAGKLEVWGGKVCAMREGKEELVENETRWVLDVGTRMWERIRSS